MGFAKSLGVYLNGTSISHPDAMGEPVTDATFYIAFNAHHNPLGFILRPPSGGSAGRPGA